MAIGIHDNECNEHCVECHKDDLFEVGAGLLVAAAECLQVNCLDVPVAAYVDVCEAAPICCEHLVVTFKGLQEIRNERFEQKSLPAKNCVSALYASYDISYGVCMTPSLGHDGKLPSDDALHNSEQARAGLAAGWCLYNCLRSRYPSSKEFYIYGDDGTHACIPSEWGTLQCERSDDCLVWMIPIDIQVNGCPVLGDCNEDCNDCPEKLEYECNPDHPCDDPDCECGLIERLKEGEDAVNLQG